jgi:hypothetical protein
MDQTLCVPQTRNKSGAPWSAVRIVLHSIRLESLCLEANPAQAVTGGIT